MLKNRKQELDGGDDGDNEGDRVGGPVLHLTAASIIETSVGGSNGAVDDEELLELGPTTLKETAADMVLGERLTEEQRVQLEELIDRYEHIFTDVLGDSNLTEHQIEVTSEEPIRSKPYAIPYNVRESPKEDIQAMLQMGVIRESKSPYASPVVVVRKDGTNRVCVDYRKLNRLMVFDPAPGNTAKEIFQKMAKKKYFTRIDLSKGYWQIPIAEKDVPKTAFVTPDGTYEFIRMPFGMVNSGATLARGMRKLIDDLDDVDNYVDDIIVHTETWEGHLVGVDELFHRLSEAKLTARPTKCVMGAKAIKVIGHQVSEGIKGLQEENVRKIEGATRPKTKKQVRAFIGLTGYYRDFIPNYAAKVAPLTDLTKKGQPNKVSWEQPQEKAFMTLKRELASEPILHLPDSAKLFVLRTNASDVGIGAVLMQDHDGKLFPVSYASRKLSPRECKYSTIERECLAIVWAIQKFQVYLYGREFVLQTDHQPLIYLNRAKFLNDRIMRWTMFLQSYVMRIESIKGSENVGADYLIRVY